MKVLGVHFGADIVQARVSAAWRASWAKREVANGETNSQHCEAGAMDAFHRSHPRLRGVGVDGRPELGTGSIGRGGYAAAALPPPTDPMLPCEGRIRSAIRARVPSTAQL